MRERDRREHRSGRRLGLLSVLALGAALGCGLAPRVHGEPPAESDPESAARAILEAHAAGDADRVRERARRPKPDPYRVADALRALGGEPDLLARVAREAAASPAGAGLDALVGRWAAQDESARAREARRRACLAGLDAAPAATPEAAVPEIEACLALAPGDAETSLTAARLLHRRGTGSFDAGRMAEADADFERTVRLARSLGWRAMEAEALYQRGRAAYARKEFATALALELESLALYRALGDAERTAWLATSAGMCHVALGAATQAEALYRDAEDVSARNDLPATGGRALSLRGTLAAAAGRHAEAADLFARAAALLERAGNAPDRVQALFNAASSHLKAGRFDVALEALDRTREVAEAANLPKMVAQCRFNHAVALQRAGRMAEAVDEYERMRPLADAWEGPALLANLERNLLFCLRALRRPSEALAHGRRAVALQLESGDAASASMLATEVALVHVDLGDLDGARAAADQALAIAQRTKAAGDIARALVCRAGIHVQSGELEAAERDAREAGRLATEAGDTKLQGHALKELGSAWERQGRYREALPVLEESLALARQRNDRGGTAMAANILGHVRWALHDFEAARAAYELAARSFADAGVAAGRTEALRNLASLLVEQRDFAQAWTVLERSNEDLESQEPRMRTSGLLVAATVLMNLGRHEEAERNLRTLERDGARLTPSQRALVTSNLGFLYSHLGRHPEALAFAERAVTEHGRIGERFEQAQALELVGHLHAQLGAWAKAVKAARASMEIRRDLARGLGMDDRRLLQLHGHSAGDVALVAILRQVSGASSEEPSLVDEALWVVEMGRARSLLEDLVHRDEILAARLGPALLQAERSASAAVRAAQVRLLGLVTRGSAAPEVLARAESEFRAAEEARRAIVRRIQREARPAASLAYPEPVGREALEAALAPDEAVVLYHLRPDGVAALVARRDSLTLVPIPSDDLPSRVEAWRALLATPGSDDTAAARALHAILVAPLAGPLKGIRRLVVSPDGPLAFLPFEALLDAEGVRLLDRHEVAYVPSASVFVELRTGDTKRTGSRRLIALGDPTYDDRKDDPSASTPAGAARGLGALGPLPQSRAEVEAVAALYERAQSRVLLGPEARVESLREAVAAADGPLAALHLACHGVFVPQHPQLSGLVLAGREVLTLEDLYRWRVPAEIVVLSACESGRGRIERGEGVVGLVRGFLFAGAPRVVVSNWNVQDESTRHLMVDVHRRLRDGQGAARALREARLAARKAHAHPYHWASFVLWGVPD